jgi:type IV pilus assembly protein PilA
MSVYKRTLMLSCRLQDRLGDQSGFTLIELLVTILIVGVLSTVALPSFLNQTSKARASEAKSGIGAINRAQQFYRIERPIFASSLSDLSVQVTGKFYTYAIAGGVTSSYAATTAVPRQDELRSVAGGIDENGGRFLQLICENQSTVLSGTLPLIPTNTNVQSGTCPVGFNSIR